MIFEVLIVDDDQEMLVALKDGLQKYHETFAVSLAENGQSAINTLQTKTISLVVTDLKMPKMDGFSLLAHIMEHYPYIPVIIITGYSTPEMRRLAKKGGAVGYIEKPFMIEDLARQILLAFRKESEGGTLHSVSSGMFLQLMEVEQKTCTIRMADKATGKKGILFFRDGELLDARMDSLQGEEAAYVIFAWDEVNLSIQNHCQITEKRIDKELQGLMLEAMRLKDEGLEQGQNLSTEEIIASVTDSELDFMPEPEISHDPIEILKEKVNAVLKSRGGIENIYIDPEVVGFCERVQQLGNRLNAGQFKLAYLNSEGPSDTVIVPNQEPIVLRVSSKTPKDKLIRALTD